MDERLPRLRVAVACPGLDHVERGYETHAQQIAVALTTSRGLDVTLVKGSGVAHEHDHREHVAWCLPRSGRIAQALGRVIPHRMGDYLVEQATFALPLYRHVRSHDVVVLSDHGVALALHALRRVMGGRFAIALVNGAPRRGPFRYADRIMQLTPVQHQVGLDAGELPGRMCVVPCAVDAGAFAPDATTVDDDRRALGLPTDRAVVVSVAALNSWHKRLDHVIHEVASMREPRPHLALVGHREDETDSLERLARDLLGDGVTIRSVSPDEVSRWLRAADVFTLASTTEGFGRAVAEACLSGLMCVVHDGPVFRYVAGTSGVYADMLAPGALAAGINTALAQPRSVAARTERAAAAAARLSWDALTDDYVQWVYDTAAARS